VTSLELARPRETARDSIPSFFSQIHFSEGGGGGITMIQSTKCVYNGKKKNKAPARKRFYTPPKQEPGERAEVGAGSIKVFSALLRARFCSDAQTSCRPLRQACSSRSTGTC
jgi:hypothetical protein